MAAMRRRLRFPRGFWRRSRRGWWRIWAALRLDRSFLDLSMGADLAGAGRMRLRIRRLVAVGVALKRASGTTATRMRTRRRALAVVRLRAGLVLAGLVLAGARDQARWTILRTSLLLAGRRGVLRRSLGGQSWWSRSLRGRRVCARERGFGTRSMAKELSFVAKGTGMTPRLQYNFNSMV